MTQEVQQPEILKTQTDTKTESEIDAKTNSEFYDISQRLVFNNKAISARKRFLLKQKNDFRFSKSVRSGMSTQETMSCMTLNDVLHSTRDGIGFQNHQDRKINDPNLCDFENLNRSKTTITGDEKYKLQVV